MGYFEATLDFIVKMTKCRPDVHNMFAKGSVPVTPRTLFARGVTFRDLSARNGLTFSTVSVLDVLQEIMTETVYWGRVSNEACGRYLRVISGGQSEVNLRSNLRLN